MGRRRTLTNINSPDWGIRMQAERQAVNFVVQGADTFPQPCICVQLVGMCMFAL